MLLADGSAARASAMTSGRLSRLLVRIAAALWIPIAAVYTALIVAYIYALATRLISPPMPEAALQLLVYASIAFPSWLLVWALWRRPSWRIAVTSAVIGVLLFILLAGTVFGIVALAAGLMPVIGMVTRPER